MTIVRVGATKQYTDGWDAAFGKSNKKTAAAKKSAAKRPAKASAKKKVRPK